MTASRRLAAAPESDLDRLAREVRTEIERADRDLLSAVRRYHRAGCLLLEARPLFPYGTWMRWLREQRISQPTASRFMALAENYSDPNNLPSSMTAAVEALNTPKPKMEGLWARWVRIVGVIPPLGSTPADRIDQAGAYNAALEADPDWRERRARALIDEGEWLIEKGQAELKAVAEVRADEADVSGGVTPSR
jgi:hypothetical protein